LQRHDTMKGPARAGWSTWQRSRSVLRASVHSRKYFFITRISSRYFYIKVRSNQSKSDHSNN